MSSVSSTDSGLANYYHRSLNELQEQIDHEAKRNREVSEKQTNALEKEYKAALLKKDADADETVKSVRDASLKSILHEKDKYEASLEQLKDQSYNNRGISGNRSSDESGLGNYYHRSLSELSDDLKEQAKKSREADKTQINQLEERYRTALLEKERESSDSIRAVKDTAHQSASQERKQLQAELDRVKNQTYDSRGQVPGGIPLTLHNQEMQDLYKSGQSLHSKDMKDAELQLENFQHREMELSEKTDNRIKNLNLQHAEELKEFDEKTKTLQNYNKVLAKQSSESSARTTRDNEKTTRSEFQSLSDSYNSNLEKLQQNMNEKDAFYSNRTNDILKGKEAHFTELLEKQNLENHRNTQEMQNEFKYQIDQTQNQRSHDQKKSAERLESAIDHSNLDNKKTLENQAAEYQKTFQFNKEATGDQISLLQKSLQKQRTSPDTQLISVALEEKISRPIVNDYEKKLHIEADKNKQSLEGIQRKYVDQYRRAIDENEDKETQMIQKNSQDISLERSRFLDTVQETESNAAAHLREQESGHDRENEHLLRQFGNSLERQRKDYEHILNSSLTDSQNRFSEFKQDSELKAKMMQRALYTRQNELVRDYEKKLADQKVEFDFKFDDLKAQNQLDMRDAERKSKQELENQAKAYEQRLAQIDLQNKEHERYISQNYQDELDRTKRSYELINKKKS